MPWTVAESFAVFVGDLPVHYQRGENVADDDPIVATHRHLLKPLAIRDRAGVIEQATAVPGERRARPAASFKTG